MNLGLLILRVVVGALFIGHGTQKLFGWFGGNGLEGTAGFFGQLGYRPGRAMAAMAGMAEAGGGLLLMLGFLTPLGAAAIIGMMLNASLSVHRPKGVWNSNGGYELPLTFAAAAACLAFTGPGRYSIDNAAGWELSGMAWGLIAVAVGLVTGMAVYGWRMAQLRRSTPERAARDFRSSAA